MILQRLIEYYDRLAADPVAGSALPKPGFSLQKVSFCVVLGVDGALQQFQSLLDPGRRKPIPRLLLLPGRSKSSGSGLNPGFLWDNAAYMLGFRTSDAKPARTRKEFEKFRALHLALKKSIDSPSFAAVCRFLEDWTPDRALDYGDELVGITGHFGVFRIAGDQRFVHDDPAVLVHLANHSDSGETGAPVTPSLASGRTGPVARLHEPKIKGVQGAQSSGALLVSFNEDAYCSFGREQSFNAPVSQSDAFKYANALNHLLRRESRPVLLGDTTVVFWAERPTGLESFISDLFADVDDHNTGLSAEDQRRTAQVRLFLSQLREGHASRDAIDERDDTRFYILGLAPNAARIAVRFWTETTIGEFRARLARHVRDVQLAGDREEDPPLLIGRLISATGRAELDQRGRVKRYDADAVPPLLAAAVARAVLSGGPYPQVLLQALLRRIRADGVVNHARVAGIKAVITRNARLKGTAREVTVALDPQRSDPGYVTGRLFALLEKIQTDSAEGEMNSTIKDRYFSSASAAPRTVFPRLIRLSQHHLGRMEPGRKIWFERHVTEVMGKLGTFAPHFSLEEQGVFAIGYYHQRQDLFTSRKDKEGEPE